MALDSDVRHLWNKFHNDSGHAHRLNTAGDGAPIDYSDILNTPTPFSGSHHDLDDLTNYDDHTQYLLLAGRAGGQIAYGGINAGDNLTLRSTSHATKGWIIAKDSIYLQANMAYDSNDYRELVFNTGIQGSARRNIGRISWKEDIYEIASISVDDKWNDPTMNFNGRNINFWASLQHYFHTLVTMNAELRHGTNAFTSYRTSTGWNWWKVRGYDGGVQQNTHLIWSVDGYGYGNPAHDVMYLRLTDFPYHTLGFYGDKTRINLAKKIGVDTATTYFWADENGYLDGNINFYCGAISNYGLFYQDKLMYQNTGEIFSQGAYAEFYNPTNSNSWKWKNENHSTHHDLNFYNTTTGVYLQLSDIDGADNAYITIAKKTTRINLSSYASGGNNISIYANEYSATEGNIALYGANFGIGTVGINIGGTYCYVDTTTFIFRENGFYLSNTTGDFSYGIKADTDSKLHIQPSYSNTHTKGVVNIGYYLWGSSELEVSSHPYAYGDVSLYMHNYTGTKAWIYFENIGVGTPLFASQSAGTKFIIRQARNGTTLTDYALGYNTDKFWLSLPSASSSYRFSIYGGETEKIYMDGEGNIGTGGTINSGLCYSGKYFATGGYDNSSKFEIYYASGGGYPAMTIAGNRLTFGDTNSVYDSYLARIGAGKIELGATLYFGAISTYTNGVIEVGTPIVPLGGAYTVPILRVSGGMNWSEYIDTDTSANSETRFTPTNNRLVMSGAEIKPAKVTTTGDITAGGDIKGAGYKSSDGSAGLSATYSFGGGSSGNIATMTFKNGILTAVTLVP